MNANDGIIKKLYKNNVLNVEQEFAHQVHLEGICGSFAYGMSGTASDIDVVGVCIPPVDWVFSHTVGHIPGFGPTPPKFENFQQHKIIFQEQEYDVSIYSIVRFFDLVAENNPNMLDVLFLPDRCITHIDNIGKLIRQNRKLFLTKHSFHKFVGYSHAQMKKLKSKNPKESRMDLIEKHGYDTKFASHVVRLALQGEQILIEHDLDIERNSEILKSVRNGAWKLSDVETWFHEKERQLNALYVSSTLRNKPEWDELRRILMCCLEEKYGSLSKIISTDVDSRILRKFEQIKQIINS